MKVVEKKKNIKQKYNMWQNSWFMIKQAWVIKEKIIIVHCISLVLMNLALSLINLYFSPVVLGAIEEQKGLYEFLKKILLFSISLMILEGLKAYISQNSLYPRVTVRSSIINLINNKVLTTSYCNTEDDQFNKQSIRAWQSCNSNNKSTEAIWNTLSNLTLNVVAFIVYLMIMTQINSILILVILTTTTVGYFINKKLQDYEYVNKDENSEIEKRLTYIENRGKDYILAKDIRIFGMKPWLDEIRENAILASYSFKKKGENYYTLGRIVNLLLSTARNGIAYSYLIAMVLENQITVAEFLLYFSTVGGFSNWLIWIYSELTSLYRQSIDISIIREVIETNEVYRFSDGEEIHIGEENTAEENTAEEHKEESSNLEVNREDVHKVEIDKEILHMDKKNKKIDYEIELENVSYSYDNKTQIIQGLNLRIKAGEKLAIVGLNGAGKTTLVKLITGLYDPSVGRVLLNGTDIRRYNRRKYYRLFSAIFQQSDLIAASIAVNVAQSEDNIDMNRVKHCIELVGLKEHIESLPGGYDAKVMKEVYHHGIMFSGGEKQRLLIARAIYKNGPIVILDEPTAALDPIAEEAIYLKYKEIVDGRTSIFISHRLSSTRFCDRIILIDSGSIIEEGSHTELMKLGGKYKELYDVQSKYYKKEE